MGIGLLLFAHESALAERGQEENSYMKQAPDPVHVFKLTHVLSFRLPCDWAMFLDNYSFVSGCRNGMLKI